MCRNSKKVGFEALRRAEFRAERCLCPCQVATSFLQDFCCLGFGRRTEVRALFKGVFCCQGLKGLGSTQTPHRPYCRLNSY